MIAFFSKDYRKPRQKMMTALILSDSSTSNQHRSSTHPYNCDETMDMMVHPTPLAMSRMIAQRDDLDDEQETVDSRIPTKPTNKKAITAANLTNSIHHKASLVYSSFPPQKRETMILSHRTRNRVMVVVRHYDAHFCRIIHPHV